MRPLLVALFLSFLPLSSPPAKAQAPGKQPPAVVELFEDEAGELIKRLDNFPGWEPGEATRQVGGHFRGLCSLRVTPMQRYCHTIPGWKYPIVETPKLGEYRYVRFAWKKSGGGNLMIQWCGDEHRAIHRHYAGPNPPPWPGLKIGDKAPAAWELVTRDLFKDFGAFVLMGIAFTPLEGEAGHFDHMYLGRTREDLDRVTGQHMGPFPPGRPLTKERLSKLWEALAHDDAVEYGPVVRALVQDEKETVAFLLGRLRTPPPLRLDEATAKLVAALDSEDFETREQAEARLRERAADQHGALRVALARAASPEVRRRLEVILGEIRGSTIPLSPEERQAIRALRVLEEIGTAEAIKTIEGLAAGSWCERLTREASEVMNRLRPVPVP